MLPVWSDFVGSLVRWKDAAGQTRIASIVRFLRDVVSSLGVLLSRGLAHAVVAGGDGFDSIEGIIRAHGRAMYRTAKGIVIDHHLAEDVVQDSLIKVWRSLDTFRGESSFRSWVLTITHHTAVSHLRRIREHAYELPDAAGRRGEHEAAETRADMTRALAELDELSRSIVVLCDVEGLSYAEAAEVLEVTEATVRSRLFRARRRLTSLLEVA